MDFKNGEDSSGISGSFIILSIFLSFIFIFLGYLIYKYNKDTTIKIKKFKKRR